MWFTSQGRTFPKVLRYEDEAGELHTIDSIQVLSRDRKNYAGIIAQKYDCRAEIQGRMIDFVLLYHPRENTWDMIVR